MLPNPVHHHSRGERMIRMRNPAGQFHPATSLHDGRLLVAGKVVMEKPRHVVIADTFTHQAHHRGQLTVYLRLNDAAVPSIYGPSADEPTFG